MDYKSSKLMGTSIDLDIPSIFDSSSCLPSTEPEEHIERETRDIKYI